MPVLRAVPAEPDPLNPAANARKRKRQREAKQAALPHCGTCTGREYIEARVGATKTKLCVACLAQGRRREMS